MNMEEKLEFRHIVPYLPYGLKIANKSLKGQIISVYEMEVENHNDKGIMNVLKGVNQILLLHPLSRLTDPILEGGETPIDWLQEKYYTLNLDAQCKRVLEDERWINQCDWLLIQHFAEWHIDFQGLIEKGLALPIDPK